MKDIVRREMKWNQNDAASWMGSILMTLALVLSAQSAGAQMQAVEQKNAPEVYQTFYLTGTGQLQDALDIQTDLRNMLPRARMFYLPSLNAISIRGTSDDIQLAQKIISDIDKPRSAHRLTYTITDIDNGKRMGAQRFTLVVVSGGKTELKQGTKVPVVTGVINEGSPTSNTQVQYLDVGLNIEASPEGRSDGLRLRTKVEQSNVAEEKSGAVMQDPVVRQTLLETTSTVVQGKPVILGSIDVPGSARRQEIEVVSEPVG
jgi:type II secretory pathway component GspD/PulD (secretin)